MSGFGGVASNEIVIAESAVAITNSLDALENTAVAVTIPALVANSKIRVECMFSKTGTQIITFRTRLGAAGAGISGTAFMSIPLSGAALTFIDLRTIRNRNATNSQVTQPLTVPFGQTSGTVVTGAIETNVATQLVLTMQQSAASVLASEVAKLEYYRVIVIN